MFLNRAMLIPMATLSVAAAAIHFAVIQEHLQEFALFGSLFLGLAWFQVLWPIPYLMQRWRLLGWIGVVVNLGAVGAWLWSRTSGLPFGPDQGEPEVAGPLDLTASAFELVLVSLLLLLLAPAPAHESRPSSSTVGAPGWAPSSGAASSSPSHRQRC